MDIEKKILPEYFQAIVDGRKTYELRLGDFEINPGDNLVLKEWDQEKNDYTGRKIETEVTYVGRFKIDELHWDRAEIEEHGLQIISFKTE